MIEQFYDLRPEVLALDRKALSLCREQFAHVEEIRDYNQLKMLRAFTDSGVEARHFWGSSGYGVWDDSRNKLEEVFARCMGAEAALVRPQFMSGTHTLTVALFGLLRTGDTLLAATGRPYDTLEGVIGIGEAGKGCGTLREYGVRYDECPLLPDFTPDYDLIAEKAKTATVVHIQRSRGYTQRNAFDLDTIQKVADTARKANPDVVTPETLLGFRQAGVNRISFGVQSADDAQLQRLGRTHTAAGAARALAWAQEAGFPDICGDIMLALPQYTNAEFDRTLALLQNGGCTHISAYLLKVEPGTAFYRNPPAGLPDADAAADFYLYAVRQLEAAGYRQYEISNFARPGHEGRHNLLYWNCEPYRGIGPAAHSCVDNVRRFWPGDVQGFIDSTIHEEIEGDCTAEDYLLMQLRLTRGLDLEEYARRGGHFTAAQQAFMRQCVTHGYAVWEGSSFRLTPAGMVVQNAILTELI